MLKSHQHKLNIPRGKRSKQTIKEIYSNSINVAPGCFDHESKGPTRFNVLNQFQVYNIDTKKTLVILVHKLIKNIFQVPLLLILDLHKPAGEVLFTINRQTLTLLIIT